jgi:hypothetical protein
MIIVKNRKDLIPLEKHYYLVIDTETANSLDCPIVYDIGGAVIDKKGNVYETFSFVIYDTYVLMKDLMQTAYYKDKMPRYEQDLKDGKRKMVQFTTAKKHIKTLCEKYNIKAVMAHNARFDNISTKTTIRYLTKSKSRYFLPHNIPIWDTLQMAKDTIAKQKTYIAYCKENGYMLKNGTPRLTAEILYRFISHNANFIESHTGLEDVLIEKEIFVRCVRQHKKMQRTYWKETA